MAAVKARSIAAAILIAGFAAMLALNAPGQMSYDSVTQLADGRSGSYNSWHPPLMAWLLGLFDWIVPGTLLFLVFQSGMLLAALLVLLRLRPRNGWSIAAALAIILTPQWLLYQGEIWKDILFADLAIAGFALLALAAERGLTWRWLLPSALCLALAAATRQNGIVLLPVAAVAIVLIGRRWRGGLVFLAATVLCSGGITLALAARGDGGDGATAQIKLGQSYDLAGALAHQPALALPLAKADPAFDRVLRTRGIALYTPLHNDPFAADPAIAQALEASPPGAVAASWKALVLGHPLLYLRTRLAVFWAVAATPDSFGCHFGWVGRDGPPELMARLGLSMRTPAQGWRMQERTLSAYAKSFFGTPVYSHLAWSLAGVLLLIILLRRRGPADLAVAALLAGALMFALTFLFIAIACDYRYLIFLDMAVMAAALYAAGPGLTKK